MLQQLLTMLRSKRTRRRRTQSPAPTLEDIRKVLKEAADIQERSAKRHAEWEIKQEKAQADWENRHAKLDDSLARIGQTVGGVTNNLGKITEEFFRQAMENEKLIVIDKAKFDTVLADQTYKANGKAMQCDLVLVNKKYIAIIEIKHYLHPDDIGRFDEKLRAVLPEVLPAAYKHLQLIPAMACKGLSLRAKEEVQKYGFALLRPRGQRSKVESEHLRIRAPMTDKESGN